MKRIVLASRNPVKVEATLGGFRAMFPGQAFRVDTVVVPSGVGDQPRSDGETLKGARARAENAAREVPEADFWVGIEGGVDDDGSGVAAFAWVVVRSGKMVGKSRTGTFFLPEEVARLLRQGVELGEADDIVFERSNSKQDNGAVGILTDDVIDRTALYEHAVALALIPFKNAALYGEKRDDGTLAGLGAAAQG